MLIYWIFFTLNIFNLINLFEKNNWNNFVLKHIFIFASYIIIIIKIILNILAILFSTLKFIWHNSLNPFIDCNEFKAFIMVVFIYINIICHEFKNNKNNLNLKIEKYFGNGNISYFIYWNKNSIYFLFG